MPSISFVTIAAWLLAAAFTIGGLVNLAGSASVRADYRRWGYPTGFHLVTGILQIGGAAMVIVPASRLLGFAILGLVCIAAALTLIRAREYAHLPPGLGFLAALVAVAILAWYR